MNLKFMKDCKTRIFEDIINIALQEGVQVHVIKQDYICCDCKEF